MKNSVKTPLLYRLGKTSMFAKIILVLAVSNLAGSAYAEEDGEVIQIADLSRAELSKYIEEAEDQLFATYNKHNIDDTYDVICRKEKPTGSNISVRACEPVFVTEVNLDKNRTDGTNLQDLQGGFAIKSLLTPDYEKLETDMKRVTSEVSAMREIYQILSQLKARREQLGG